MELAYGTGIYFCGCENQEVSLLKDQLRRFWGHRLVQDRTLPVPGIDDEEFDGKPALPGQDVEVLADNAGLTVAKLRLDPEYKTTPAAELRERVAGLRFNFIRACHTPQAVNREPRTEEERFLWRLWRDHAYYRHHMEYISNLRSGSDYDIPAIDREILKMRRLDEKRLSELDRGTAVVPFAGSF